MVRDALAEALRAALSALDLPVPVVVELERPARREHGDWSSNVAMATAKQAGRNPRELATTLVEWLTDPAHRPPHVERIEVAGPGFVNFHLRDSWLHEVLVEVVEAGEADFARHRIGGGERVMVEFVSANPTGPLHVGNGWWAAYGDALARLLQRCGWEVTREYYVNDTGGQIRRLGESLLARRRGEDVPEDGYPGDYVAELAARYDGPDDVRDAGRWAAELILDDIRDTLDSIHIHYDEWFSQASIEESEAMGDTIAILDDKGLVFEEDGALWLRTGDFGDPREKRVLRRSDGEYTYLAGDIAYHRNKFFLRGFDRVINVWGADHQGQVPSLLAAVEALGIDRGRLEVRLGQMVSLVSGRMSKRAGNTVDLSDLIAEIGPDVTRLLSMQASIDQASTVDLEAIRQNSAESPVYYVQYAYARIASIGRKAVEMSVERLPLEAVDLSVLDHERELDVLRSLSELPDTVLTACVERAPHRVAFWARELARRFHGFYADCYVLGDVPPARTQARLWLVEAVRVGLTVALELLGVTRPESMYRADGPAGAAGGAGVADPAGA
jgi:arginyl-tRNA synthetase